MGLCKCRVVTNLFCFEHRKNVCEKCLVTDHPRCVVRSYLQWLQDSDYDPDCGLCHKSLDEGEVVRLVCYDVFHWACLDKYAQSFPAHTAPAGFTCPTCRFAIIPKENLASPIADLLRKQLSSTEWAQTGLGRRSFTQTPESSRLSIDAATTPRSRGYDDEHIESVHSHGISADSSRAADGMSGDASASASVASSPVGTSGGVSLSSGGGAYRHVDAMAAQRDWVTVVDDPDDDKYKPRGGALDAVMACFSLSRGKASKRSFVRKVLLMIVAAIGLVVVWAIANRALLTSMPLPKSG